MPVEGNYQIKLIGYCALSKEEILKKFIKEGQSSLTNLIGEYVIVIENNIETYLITSAYGVCQYYYTVQENNLFHDDTVIGVLKKSGLSWAWNWTTLADLSFLDHVLENDTLHSQIYRVLPGSTLHFQQGSLTLSSLKWEDLNPFFSAKPSTALNLFNQSIETWAKDDVVVSMSGGFDSRVILSSLLKQGCKPSLLTMGSENSTDVVISQQIASELGLDLSVVKLNIEDYLKYGYRVAALTNGTKTARHWHTYLYCLPIKDADSVFFVGTNGEFARTFYFDKGRMAMIKNWLDPSSNLRQVWQQRLNSIFKPEEIKGLHPGFAQEFDENHQSMRLKRLMDLSHNTLLPGLDRFYLEQRVKNFMGNGLKLYSENVSWRAPFLSAEWISTIWNLPRSWKLGSNWHRFAIQKNYPKLLNFPEEGKAERMYAKAPLGYWQPSANKYPVVSYANYPEWFSQDLIVDFIIENAALISDLITESTVKSIVIEHKENRNRLSTVAFLVSLIFWMMNLQEVYTSRHQSIAP